MRDLYGRNGAETVSGLCGTRVVLASPDRDTAQWSADSLGRSEVEEVAEGFSYGANTIRDGVSLTPKRELRALALASEIMRLENLSGYLRFPGPLPVATIRLDYVDRGKTAERFVPRDDAEDDGRGGATKAEPGGSHPGAGSPEAAAATEAEIPDPQGELEFRAQGCDDDSCDESGIDDPGSEPSPAAPDAAAGEDRGDKAGGNAAAADLPPWRELPLEEAGEEPTDRVAAVDGETPGSAERDGPAGNRKQDGGGSSGSASQAPECRAVPGRASGSEMLSIGALTSAAPGRKLLRARRLLREGRSRPPRGQCLDWKGRGGTRARRPG